ncbi:MAG: hypothetical protein KF767_07725 [Bdellovibrionaceae bacterium]|nr:hypothetical protein [Pseudobdellovibrionaceae bacterium]
MSQTSLKVSRFTGQAQRFAGALLSLSLLSIFAHAEPAGLTSSSSLQFEKAGVTGDATGADAYVRFESMQYPTLLQGQENLSQSNMMEAGLKAGTSLNEGDTLSAQMDLAAGRSLNLNYSYISVYEASVAMTSPSRQFSLRLGRHLTAWNDADRVWNMNLWNPTFAMDALRIQQQGLMGLFLAANGTYLQAQAFFSPAFIPTMTPEVADRNGEITSESRWFRSIPTQSEIIGRPTRLYYRLEIPQIQELISQPAIGGQIRVGRTDTGPWARLSVADKAINTLFFKYDANFRTATDQQARGEVELRPLAQRHLVTGLDLGLQFDGGEVVLSHVQDRPTPAKIDNPRSSEGLATDFIQQSPRPLRATTIRWDQHNLRVPFTTLPLQGRLAYLKADAEPTLDYDAAGQQQSSLIPHRLNYTNAVTVEGKAGLSARWNLGLKYLRDFDQRGSQWNMEVSYHRGSWIAVVGGDSLGVDDSSVTNGDTRFLNYYRQNDRVYGGLTYVF